ncbi:hypothetical protein DRP53_05385 [candidate division WOR-3 bacterium]|uniref:Uncharacterized protein n=1 Tax=candidate division WOR-3 bacterium TaxID=2052148 RepID=A0A660SII4_UNCW3|nr:MAG: hypothetical protein DRP53_05385 [candidate division WOR-3 bacterium]
MLGEELNPPQSPFTKGGSPLSFLPWWETILSPISLPWWETILSPISLPWWETILPPISLPWWEGLREGERR